MTAYSPTRSAVAYVNWGRWVADCPNGCGNAEKLIPGQDAYRCSNCEQVAIISWPDNSAAIWNALTVRILQHRRNWYPAGHQVALMAGLPHGQTAEDLMRETLAHENDTE